MDVLKHQDYREILHGELARRIKQNPRYSQGAFARDLALTPSRLSEILHGKQGVSTQVAQQIARLMRFSEEETQYFLDLVESQHGRSRLLREAARIRLQRFRRSPLADLIGDDTFHLISDWYNLAVMELLRLDHVKAEPDYIARSLRIPVEQARDALQRLERLGLLKRNEEGALELVKAQQNFVGSVESESFQKFCRQILWKAIEAVDETRPHAMHSYMVAVAEKNLPQLMATLRETCNRLAERMDVDIGAKDTVYCLSTQFFPVSECSSKDDNRKPSQPS
jgi:uncharacterized protein (TIGR02147 family)